MTDSHSSIEIGDWALTLPLGWSHDPEDEGTVRFKSQDAALAMYVRTIDPLSANESAKDIIGRAMSAHMSGFMAEGDPWEIVSRTFREADGVLHASLEMWDRSSEYRVLCMVASRSDGALMVTLHDYLAPSGALQPEEFGLVAESVRWQGSA